MPISERQTSTPACCAALLLVGLGLSACTVGPSFVRPELPTPPEWPACSADATSEEHPLCEPALSTDWWRVLADPVLDDLQNRALAANADLRTAALHFAQARMQRNAVAAQRGVHADVSGTATRQRQSKFGATTRMLDILSNDSEMLKQLLAEPFNLYQVGFDASWEPDLWGKVHRSIEAADASIGQQSALFDLTKLTVTSEVARSYVQWRATQRQIQLKRDDIDGLNDRLSLLQVRIDEGVQDYADLYRQKADLAATHAALAKLETDAVASANQLAMLIGQSPGTLSASLRNAAMPEVERLPDLGKGLPSEVARQRPDVRAAEARLHRATASIGIAQADLYPSIRLGARFGYESHLSGEFADWGSRTWSLGPTLNLPLFDHGRRKSVVQLRKLEHQEAAVAFQASVLQAWHEIDNAFARYHAAQDQLTDYRSRQQASHDALDLAQSRYDAGLIDYLAVIESRRAYLAAQSDLAGAEAQLLIQFVAISKSLANGQGMPRESP